MMEGLVTKKYSKELSIALYQALLRRIPPKKNSKYLEDIVNTLMDALSRGDIYLDFELPSTLNELKMEGWPIAHKKALHESGWLDGEQAPLVLEKNYLSWRKWNEEMNLVIKELLHRSKQELKESNLCPNLSIQTYIAKQLNKEQMDAVNAVYNEKVILLSGGPGTGKTSTIVNMLVKALSINESLNIGLSAPTGKAARRLNKAIKENLSHIDNSYKDLLLNIPCMTLHAWLQAQPSGFFKNSQNPISLEMLVIDEMSMVDLSLMKGLLDAIPNNCQLILVGDPRQLPPVGCGAVWSHLQRKEVREEFAHGNIHLIKTYRNHGEIAQLAEKLTSKGEVGFWMNFSEQQNSNNIGLYSSEMQHIPSLLIDEVNKHQNKLNKLAKQLVNLEINISDLEQSQKPDLIDISKSLLSYLDELLILCPKKNGLWGVNQVNKSFLGLSYEKGVQDWPEGTPVMCTQNQTELGLANGDIGVAIGKGNKRRLLYEVNLNGKESLIKLIHPARLIKVEPAIAMTIHKSQGSEATHIILLWPDKSIKTEAQTPTYESNYQSKLLYTAITRAKNRLDLFTPSY